jgi:tetratricopeptide (TPR) repeat protein
MKYSKLKFEIHDFDVGQNGHFVWGNSRNEIFDRYYNAVEKEDPEETAIEFEEILTDDPEFIDAYSSLGFMELDYYNNGNAFHYFNQGYQIGSNLIPKNFSGQIIWGMMENRAFLRTMQGLGLTYLFMREWDSSSKIFEKILNYNPNDNQGIRALIIQSYLAMGKFDDILKIIKLFPEDTMPDTLYGAVLANYRQNKIEKAEKALQDAIKFSPNIAKELVKKRHKKVTSDFPATLCLGGEDEAYDYWKRVGLFWADPMLIKFLENGIERTIT